MRKAPYPLSVHLGILAANKDSGIHQYASKVPYELSEAHIIEIIRGIKCYIGHPYTPEPQPYKKIWELDGISIKRPTGTFECEATGVPILFVPSMINKANIFDIHEQNSMLRWFRNKGADVYLLEWGDISAKSENALDIESLTQNILPKSIHAVSDICGRPIDVLGYCMGGTLLIGAYSFASDHIRRMTLLATPWDFHVSAFGMAKNIQQWSPYVTSMLENSTVLPSAWLQALFASFEPQGSAHKFARFASLDQGGSDAELFVSVEDWLNDGDDLPKDIAQHCIQQWFVKNTPMKGEWTVSGKIVAPNDIKSDVLIVASSKDRIVPHTSAFALIDQLTAANVQSLELDYGHIGLIVGRHAKKEVWQPIFSFFNSK